MASRSTPSSSAQRSRGAAIGRLKVGSWASHASMPGSLDEHVFEQQWDEAGEHPGHDVCPMTRGGRRRASAGLLTVHHESGPLAARQPVLARCLDVAAKLADSRGERDNPPTLPPA
jgi:hypothetical protein